MPSLYIVLEQDIGFESPDFVEVLSEWLEDVGETTGVSLMRFFGQDPSAFFEVEDLGQEAAERWFAPEQGIKAIEALLGQIQTDTSYRAHQARNELLEMLGLLEAAQNHKTRFHIALDI